MNAVTRSPIRGWTAMCDVCGEITDPITIAHHSDGYTNAIALQLWTTHSEWRLLGWKILLCPECNKLFQRKDRKHV